MIVFCFLYDKIYISYSIFFFFIIIFMLKQFEIWKRWEGYETFNVISDIHMIKTDSGGIWRMERILRVVDFTGSAWTLSVEKPVGHSMNKDIFFSHRLIGDFRRLKKYTIEHAFMYHISRSDYPIIKN